VNKKEAKKTLIRLMWRRRCLIRAKRSKSFFGSFFSKKELLTGAVICRQGQSPSPAEACILPNLTRRYAAETPDEIDNLPPSGPWGR